MAPDQQLPCPLSSSASSAHCNRSNDPFQLGSWLVLLWFVACGRLLFVFLANGAVEDLRHMGTANLGVAKQQLFELSWTFCETPSILQKIAGLPDSEANPSECLLHLVLPLEHLYAQPSGKAYLPKMSAVRPSLGTGWTKLAGWGHKLGAND